MQQEAEYERLAGGAACAGLGQSAVAAQMMPATA
jgi:hypothetical protein